MKNKEFVLEVFRIVRGNPVYKIAMVLLVAGIAALGAAPWWNTLLTPVVAKYFDVKISDPSTLIGFGLIALGVLLTLINMRHIHNIEVLKVSSNPLSEEVQKNHSDDAFFRFRAEVEESALSILRRLIDKHFGIHATDPILAPIGARVRYGDKEAVFQYVDTIVVGPTSHQAKLDFFALLGDGTGQPLAYKFVRIYEELVVEAGRKSKTQLVSGTPLSQTFQNVTHVSMQPLREQAYWEAYV
ncbi:hypothetical protein RYA07_19200 [Pseudomonas syringae pv. actinidiae]|uniref:Pseudopilin PulG n=1 Tax=Pseudomonas syringae pv. actinidiae TaxID=103796 RepID=A0A2V0QLE7_PSESF|nr:hypothetical protein [Pseudomonas syringae]EPM90715.1 hypothetical protein A259_39997 [Pseudomonas syringae pv. actinidiae ICMP 19070]MDU8490514.1 hypothetical protein [Pseudomonas syringae pv. actinidiae]NVL27961.1 hypothetical protein [Pseudomonas syringae pv. actinidiae]NVL29717.1 hypothetical protein [Pseudomonas syringae pv. actinidiae]NVL34614.1 hypothetical protein [Pseudomonas syringae pv. actinidiae]